MRTQFGRRLLGLPMTQLARVSTASGGGLEKPWHYWWQAHYVDALVDASQRRLRDGDPSGASATARTAGRVVASVWLRGGFTFRNEFHDDVAWLALAVHRLGGLHRGLGTTPPRWLGRAEATLTAQLRSAVTEDLGGGAFWSTARDFKNVPATGPVALLLASQGDRAAARSLVDWVFSRLQGDDSGLLQDGIRLVDGAERLVDDLYTYNQGTVLGALLELGDPVSLGRAAALVAAVDRTLTEPRGRVRVLVTHGGGDGGLFTGILARYLTTAALHPGLDRAARQIATRLVLDTAEALWIGRRSTAAGALVLPRSAIEDTDLAGQGQPVELSTQVQAWTILEQAAVL